MLPQKFSAATTSSLEAPPPALLAPGAPAEPQQAANAARATRITTAQMRGRTCSPARRRERERHADLGPLITRATISRLSLVLSRLSEPERRAGGAGRAGSNPYVVSPGGEGTGALSATPSPPASPSLRRRSISRTAATTIITTTRMPAAM